MFDWDLGVSKCVPCDKHLLGLVSLRWSIQVRKSGAYPFIASHRVFHLSCMFVCLVRCYYAEFPFSIGFPFYSKAIKFPAICPHPCIIHLPNLSILGFSLLFMWDVGSMFVSLVALWFFFIFLPKWSSSCTHAVSCRLCSFYFQCYGSFDLPQGMRAFLSSVHFFACLPFNRSFLCWLFHRFVTLRLFFRLICLCICGMFCCELYRWAFPTTFVPEFIHSVGRMSHGGCVRLKFLC